MADCDHDRFDGYDKERIKLTQNNRMAEKINGDEYASIYGSVLVPNQTSKTFKWKIKCIKYTDPSYWGLGICSAQDKHYKDNFYAEDQDCEPLSAVSYAYEPSGDMFECGKGFEAAKWKSGDIITLCYQGKTRKLSVSVNGEHIEDTVRDVKDNPQGFRMAVVMYNQGDMVEIIGPEQDTDDTKCDGSEPKLNRRETVNM